MFTLIHKPTSFSVKVTKEEFNQLLLDSAEQGYTVSSLQQDAKGNLKVNFKLSI